MDKYMVVVVLLRTKRRGTGIDEASLHYSGSEEMYEVIYGIGQEHDVRGSMCGLISKLNPIQIDTRVTTVIGLHVYFFIHQNNSRLEVTMHKYFLFYVSTYSTVLGFIQKQDKFTKKSMGDSDSIDRIISGY